MSDLFEALARIGDYLGGAADAYEDSGDNKDVVLYVIETAIEKLRALQDAVEHDTEIPSWEPENEEEAWY